MKSSSRLTWIGLGALALAGCDRESLPVVCTPSIEQGLYITVVDSVTGAPPPSAALIARSGTYVDSVGPYAVQPGSLLILTAVPERVGTYDLTVRSPGYLTWTRTGVRITSRECHVRTVYVTARLRKQG